MDLRIKRNVLYYVLSFSMNFTLLMTLIAIIGLVESTFPDLIGLTIQVYLDLILLSAFLSLAIWGSYINVRVASLRFDIKFNILDPLYRKGDELLRFLRTWLVVSIYLALFVIFLNVTTIGFNLDDSFLGFMAIPVVAFIFAAVETLLIYLRIGEASVRS